MKPKTEAERLSQRERTLIVEKRHACVIANQLRYPQEIIDRIGKAKTESQITEALAEGRKRA